ncbi:MAG: hypothetical protein IKC84_03055 [Helicobacteraceae bacterium]|nr:hypothetical protein [Helicobacteraceae bacterium]
MAVRYSFTTPQPKYIVSKLTKIWIFYVIVSVIIVYFGGIYLKIEVNMLNNNAQIVENNMNIQDKKIALINKNIERLKYEANLDNINKNYNNEVQQSLLNLFALIPDQITITQIKLEEEKLTLKGITPTRELYSFLLQAPLRSIFTTSRVDFFPLPNGWFNFTSISVLNKEAK